MVGLARWCARHRKLVLAVWLAALILFGALDRSVGSNFQTKFSLPNTESTRALSILEQQFPSRSGEADQIVLHARRGTLHAADVQRQVTRMLDRVAKLPHVETVISPYSPVATGQISRDQTIGFATVYLSGQTQAVPKAAVRQIIATAEAANSPSLQVALGGNAIENAQPLKGEQGTGLGIIFALIVLLIAFGAVLAAVLPLITALAAVGIGTAITGLLSHVIAIPTFATILGVLIGLGVGVDYALFIVSRHRSGLRAGSALEDSIANALNTSGRAVFFAGLTVCIALLGQFALGVSFLYGVAVSASITVALTMLASLTLLPALLGFFGRRVLSRRERARLAATGPVGEKPQGFWYRWARLLERHPAVSAAAGVAIMVVVAIPVLSLHLGLSDSGTDPPSSTTRQAYDLLARGFGPGFNGPFDIVGRVPSPRDAGAFDRLVARLADQPGVATITPARLSTSGKAAVSVLYPTTPPSSLATTRLLNHIRHEVIPSAERGSTLRVDVGGDTAIGEDFAHVLSGKLPLFIGVVVVLAFLLLMAVFRSLLIPLAASVMNLLSVGAALGILTATFQWGWGRSLLGFSQNGPVEVFVPVIMFSILFGLSMDYEVFLVSRIHEEWVHRRDNRLAVTLGQAETGRVITAAAAIMILVFASFILGGTYIIQQFGIGLAGAILIDAFVVRTLLVPSLMHLLGRANWWLPGWLARALPRLAVDAPPPEATEPAAQVPAEV